MHCAKVSLPYVLLSCQTNLTLPNFRFSLSFVRAMAISALLIIIPDFVTETGFWADRCSEVKKKASLVGRKGFFISDASKGEVGWNLCKD